MHRFRPLLALLATLLLIVGQQAHAQSLLRDAETEAFLYDIGKPLMEAAGLNPASVHVGIINDSSVNAFATLGQQVYFHSGLIVAAKDVLELQGVYAHELGHVAGGHAVRFGDGVAPATNISLLSLVVGAALLAAGAGDAGMAAMMAGQQAATGKFLAFSREQESRTDQAGARYLEKAGVDGSGMISFFRQLQGDEYRLAIPQDNSYNRTHPLSGERVASLEDVLERSPMWKKGADPQLQARYQRIRAKLIGYLYDPERTLLAYPPSDTSEPARIARAYAFHKLAEPDKALAELDAMLVRSPKDPYLLEMKGQVQLESGRVEEALPALRAAVKLSDGQPLIASMLGHALVQAGEKSSDDKLYAEAERVLKAAVARDDKNPFAWLQLATIYERRGDKPRLALATAERMALTNGDPRGVLRSAQIAAAELPAGTPERLRAQDLVLVASNQVEERRKSRRND